MKKLQATVTIKTQHIEKVILDSKKYQTLKEGMLSIEKAQDNNLFYVKSMDDLIELSDLIGLLNELSERDLNLVDSVTIPLEQLKFIESFLV